jgi:hypothetical protein
MTLEEIEALEKLLAAATPGVWEGSNYDVVADQGVPNKRTVVFRPGQNTRADAALTAAAVNALGDLLAAAKREIELRAALQNVRAALLIIANFTQCADNVMSDKEIAKAALSGLDAIMGEEVQP